MAACLVILAASGLLSCADTPVQAPDSVSLATVPGTDSVKLTYICGNMFRVRNSSFEPRNVRWDIYNVVPADTGSLRTRGRDVGSGYVDYFVTSRTKGTMRLFVGATLVDTKANGNKVACTAPADTSPIPGQRSRWFGLAQEPMARDLDGLVVSRTILSVTFDPAATSSSALRSFLRGLNAQIVRVMEPGFLYLRIPDPGQSADTLNAIEQRAKQQAFIQRAAFVLLEVKPSTDGARYSTDRQNQSVDPNPGGGSCSDLCEDACCFGIFKINKRNFPIARIRADSQARRVNY